jgi:hypothetical protein
MEDAVLVVQRLALLADALLARAERAEVLGRLGHRLAVESHDDAASSFAADRHVEEHLVRHHGALGRHRHERQRRAYGQHRGRKHRRAPLDRHPLGFLSSRGEQGKPGLPSRKDRHRWSQAVPVTQCSYRFLCESDIVKSGYETGIYRQSETRNQLEAVKPDGPRVAHDTCGSLRR